MWKQAIGSWLKGIDGFGLLNWHGTTIPKGIFAVYLLCPQHVNLAMIGNNATVVTKEMVRVGLKGCANCLVCPSLPAIAGLTPKGLAVLPLSWLYAMTCKEPLLGSMAIQGMK